MKFRYFLTLSIIFILFFASCIRQNHLLYFDIEDQTFCSCNSISITNLSIKNDSITNTGFPVEGGVLISFSGDSNEKIANCIKLNNIPNNYKVFIGGKYLNQHDYKLKPNSSYTVEKYGSGTTSFLLRIWTDSLGRVFKTTHPNCEL